MPPNNFSQLTAKVPSVLFSFSILSEARVGGVLSFYYTCEVNDQYGKRLVRNSGELDAYLNEGQLNQLTNVTEALYAKYVAEALP